MSARDKERYYWLKLDRGFFKRHDITVIEDMPNGKDYVLFYLKLMLESVDHEGALRFSDTIPYSESMLASVTKTNIDIVRSAMKIFTELGMIEVFDDKTLFMKQVADLLDSETYAAKRKREQREDNLQGDIVPRLSPVCPQEIDIEIEKEIDTEKDIITEPVGSVCRTKDVRRITEAWNSLGLQQVTKITGDSKRGGMLRARVNEYGVDGVLSAIEKIRESDFLKGQNSNGWVITFEWFVKPNNFVKVMEGNYSNQKEPQKKHRQYTTAAEYKAPTLNDASAVEKLRRIQEDFLTAGRKND